MADSMEALAGALASELRGILDQAREAPKVPQSNHQTITVHHADPPKPEPKMAWVCAVATILSMMVAGFSVAFAIDARAEMRAANASRENDIRELRQADRSVMAYIQTGRVPVLSQDERKKSP